MSAPRVVIDDLTWADLLRLTLEDIPAASQGGWTLHGPVDPGITLVELFAFQLEQHLFMAQQLTEPVIRASLRLLDVDEPAPARAARTVLAFPPAPAALVPGGTVARLADDPLQRRFALAEDVWILPVDGVTVEGSMARTGDALDLVLQGQAPVTAGARLSLLLEVEAAPGVAPSWSIAAAAAHPPATLRWRAMGADGAAEVVEVDDQTGGLRRAGLVRLPWPGVWNRPGPGRRRLRAEAVAASYTEPVRILGVHPNAAVAEHREEQVTSVPVGHLLPLPGQRVTVPGGAGRLLDAALELVEPDGRRHRWQAVGSWVAIGPADRVFLVDRERGQLVFGDGRAGRIPRPRPDEPAQLVAGLGGGADGNLGSGRAWAAGGRSALNPVAAEGGADAEGVDRARQRAAGALARADRTVTTDDAVDLAVSTPGVGVARAWVTVGAHPHFPCDPVATALTVTVVPAARRATPSADWTPTPRPDDGLVATVTGRLRAARLIGQEVFVARPAYHAVQVSLSLAGAAPSENTREAVADALRRHLDPLEGGNEGKGWPFGGPVRPSELLGVVQDVVGPETEVTRVAVSLNGGPPADCGDTAIPAGHLVWLAGVTIDAAASLPGGGGLR